MCKNAGKTAVFGLPRMILAFFCFEIHFSNARIFCYVPQLTLYAFDAFVI